MNNIRLAIAMGVFVVASLLIAIVVNRKNDKQKSPSEGRTILYYRDPMHPSYTSAKPGNAPDCGMALEAVYADEIDSKSGNPAAGEIKISAGQQQMIGVQVMRVQRSAVTQTTRVSGRVALDENRVYPLIANGEGWVTEVLASATDSTVKKGQPLVAVYGREYVSTQRMYLYGLRSAENPPPAGDSYQDPPALALQEARLNLVSLGMGDEQIQKLTSTHRVMLNVTLVSPASGTVISRNVFPNGRFSSGTELFRIADLKKVWAVMDLSADDAVRMHAASGVSVSLPGRRELKFHAKIAEGLPRFDVQSGSLKLRLEIDNPNLILRPEMLVEADLPVHLPAAIIVPIDSVIESGAKKVVFVSRGEGRFERRSVETGLRLGDRIQIVRGLESGESIVVAGNFLLDSESQIKLGAPSAQ